jgi:hypothetical protein
MTPEQFTELIQAINGVAWAVIASAILRAFLND